MPDTPLIDDSYGDAPVKRTLTKVQALREGGRPTVGIYCCYAPLELIWAAGGVPVGLCATSHIPIAEAETILPANLCPLIKSSFGFIISDTCPFYKLSDVVVAETTCDGKKKMFELIKDRKPTLILELSQMPDEDDSYRLWLNSVWKMRRFLETSFQREISDTDIREAILEANERRKLILEISRYAGIHPPVINWMELKEITSLADTFPGPVITDMLHRVLKKLERRRRDGLAVSAASAPRVMVTGCPLGGDAEKVYHIIEDAGGVVVAQEACSGIKPVWTNIEDGNGDPMAAIARRYFDLPCSCMTPNSRRLAYIDQLIESFKPDAVIDVVLNGCHTYNIESHVIKEHVTAGHGLPFLKIETDYSEGDVGQLQTRVGALLEIAQDSLINREVSA